MNNLEEVRLRQTDSDFYLVPVSAVIAFDKLQEQIDESDGTNEWYDYCAEFDNLFSEYEYEGDIYDIKLFIENDKKI